MDFSDVTKKITELDKGDGQLDITEASRAVAAMVKIYKEYPAELMEFFVIQAKTYSADDLGKEE